MWKKIIKGDTSKGQAPSNAGTRNTSEVAQASSSTGLKRNSNDDRSSELARRMQEHEDKISGYNRAQDSQSSSQNRDNKGAAYPEAIQDDLDAVREFISDVMATTCYKCDTQLIHEFTAAKWFKKWETAQKHNDNPSICAAICPQSRCNALTCLGCGNKPFIGQNTKHVEGYKVDWCCETGQLFAIWLLLCRYDEVELAVQARSTDASSKTSSTMGRPHQGSSNGTGYGGAGSQYSPPGYLYNMGRVGPQLEFKKTDSQTDNVTQIIFSLINALLPLYENEEPPIGLHEMIELSFFQDRAAQLLRNDSIADVAKRGKLYRSVITFVEKVGTHPHTRFLIMDGRYSRKKSPGLGPLSLPDPSIIANGETASGRNKDKGKTKNKRKAATALDLEVEEGEMSGSLLDNMQNLSIICEALIKTAKATRTGFDDRSGRDMLSLARYIADVYERIDRIREKQERKNRKTKSNGDSESTKQSSPWEQYNVEHRVEYSTSVMANMLSSYRVRAEQMRESPTGRIRRIFTELVDMITSLTPGIFVRAQIERPDVIKALIVGPQDTPYEGGLFEFDIFCPKDYPAVSPNCWFRTTNGGRVRFNPNLHADGKVCLSLLGTWPGRPEEQWHAGQSTILQVLISIQAMIFNDEPWRNEPGADGQVGSEWWTRGDRMAGYNRHQQAQTVRFAMLDWLQRRDMRNGFWKDVVTNYFQLNHTKILSSVREWTKSNPNIEKYKGGEGGPFDGSGFGNTPNLLTQLESALGRGVKEGKQSGRA